MLGNVGLVLLFALVACAGTTVPRAEEVPLQSPQKTLSVAAPASDHVPELLKALAKCSTADEMRARLEAGLDQKELQHVGFEQVTISQCVDCVISAVLDIRKWPGDQLVLEKLSDSVDLYIATLREAAVRRTAGVPSCLPTMR